MNEFKNIPKIRIDNKDINEAVETICNYLKDNNMIIWLFVKKISKSLVNTK